MRFGFGFGYRLLDFIKLTEHPLGTLELGAEY